jgi:chemotaxis regulatin CheY-phosphate phosphatase CheZ
MEIISRTTYMYSINKELLLARLAYLNEINDNEDYDDITGTVSQKVKELVENAEITSYMVLEAVYDYLKDKLKENVDEVDKHTKDIISFLN